MITSTEFCPLDMEHNHKENEAETPIQNVSNILQKNLNMKIKSILTKGGRRAWKELQKDGKFRMRELDQGCGIAIVVTRQKKKKTRRSKKKIRPNK